MVRLKKQSQQLGSLVFILLIMFSSFSFGQPADNIEKQKQAKAVYDQAIKLFKQETAKSYKAALLKFQEAIRLFREVNNKNLEGLSLSGIRFD